MKTLHYMFVVSVACIASALAVDPPPDGGYPNENTAEGEDALFSLTTGSNNTALGYHALHASVGGTDNTAVGQSALAANTAGISNTAVGSDALLSSTTAAVNTAVGYETLQLTTTGSDNTALGALALTFNTTGSQNTVVGLAASEANTTGSQNTAVGWDALSRNHKGTNNIALGYQAGKGCHGSDNIMIGNLGTLEDQGAIRIGTVRTHRSATIAGISGVTVAGGVGVVIDSDGQLGTTTSSARYKDDIKPMDKSSEVLLSLKPVTFRYKKNLDPKAIPQFGLVAEQVEKVDPDLVAYDDQGKPYSVRYEAVNAMLLNEFLKEHRKVEALEAKVARLEGMVEKVGAAQQAESSSAPLVTNE
ncbi:MAG TPA: tail fiber domain-containing protein [Chthoniobacterales bacterium]|jgi:hypothetical protein